MSLWCILLAHRHCIAAWCDCACHAKETIAA